MFESLVRLFSEMNTLVIVFFVVGLLLCIAEIFMSGFGVCGGLGIALTVVAIILRMIDGGDIWMLLYMVIIVGGLLSGLLVLISRSLKNGFLSRTSMFSVGNALPSGLTEGTKDFTHLIGKEGISLTSLRPIGQADFNGEVVDVIASLGFIEAKNKVKVQSVEGQKINVIKIKEEK